MEECYQCDEITVHFVDFATDAEMSGVNVG
jgi:hypothetical protein